MDGLIEDDLRLVLVREFRQLTNEQNIDEDRRSPFRVSRATGNVNDRSVDAALLEILLNAECVRRIRIGCHPATIYCAGSEGNNSVSAFSSVSQDVGTDFVGDAQSLAVPSLQNCTFVNEDVVA